MNYMKYFMPVNMNEWSKSFKWTTNYIAAVNANACVCKVPSNICGVKKAIIAKPTGVSHQGYWVLYICVLNKTYPFITSTLWLSSHFSFWSTERMNYMKYFTPMNVNEWSKSYKWTKNYIATRNSFSKYPWSCPSIVVILIILSMV